MDYIKETLGEKYVIGIAIRTSNEDNRFLQDMPPLWDRFYREDLAEMISHHIEQNLLANISDYEKDHTRPFTYLLDAQYLI